MHTMDLSDNLQGVNSWNFPSLLQLIFGNSFFVIDSLHLERLINCSAIEPFNLA